MTDDDLRSMLLAKAAEATVSEDAWLQIAARVAEPAPSRAGRRLAVAGVAVAAAAATVFAANLPGSPSQVAESTTTAPPVTAPADVIEEPHVFAAPAGLDWTIEQTAHGYLLAATELDPGDGELRLDDSGESGVVTYLRGPVASEVFLRRLEGRWVVDSAASDLVPIFDPVFEDGLLRAEVGIEAAGALQLTTGGAREDGRESVEVQPVTFRQQVPVRASLPDARYARVQAVLRSDDGQVGVSATWVDDHAEVDPAVSTGPITAVWPAVDDAGLAQLQADADEGLRPDLLDPVAVAGGYLAELLPRERSAQRYEVGELREGDPTSGEVPFEIDGTPAGEVLLRRERPGGIWHVAGVTSPVIRLEGPGRVGDAVTLAVDGPFDRYEVLARTAGGGTVRASGPAASGVELRDAVTTRWVQVVAYADDRIVGIAVVPVAYA